MKKDLALKVAAIVFALVAFAHALRLFFKTDIMVSGYILPMDASIFGLVFTGILAIWMWLASRK